MAVGVPVAITRNPKRLFPAGGRGDEGRAGIDEVEMLASGDLFEAAPDIGRIPGIGIPLPHDQ